MSESHMDLGPTVIYFVRCPVCARTQQVVSYDPFGRLMPTTCKCGAKTTPSALEAKQEGQAMTPTWAQLHAMEPGLRPRYMNPAGDTFELEPYRGGMGWQHVGTPKIVQLDVVQNWEASCRDRARQWLATQHLYWTIEVSDGRWTVFDVNQDSPVGEWRGHESYDEAVRAACAAVIGGRKS